jgi:hypothetical protein
VEDAKPVTPWGWFCAARNDGADVLFESNSLDAGITSIPKQIRFRKLTYAKVIQQGVGLKKWMAMVTPEVEGVFLDSSMFHTIGKPSPEVIVEVSGLWSDTKVIIASARDGSAIAEEANAERENLRKLKGGKDAH